MEGKLEGIDVPNFLHALALRKFNMRTFNKRSFDVSWLANRPLARSRPVSGSWWA